MKPTDEMVDAGKSAFANLVDDATDERIVRAVLTAALASQPEAGAGEHPVVKMLIAVARAAYDALDNSETADRPTDDGQERIRILFEPWSDQLRWSVEALATLPDDQPGCVMSPAAKAEWALRAPAPSGMGKAVKAGNAMAQMFGDLLVGPDLRPDLRPRVKAIREAWLSALKAEEAGS